MLVQLRRHVTRLKACTACSQMIGPVVTGVPVISPVMLIGQAPGDKEGPVGKPFAWIVGKMLFQWFASIGMTETIAIMRHRLGRTGAKAARAANQRCRTTTRARG